MQAHVFLGVHFILIGLLFQPLSAFAAEPGYCKLDSFRSKRVSYSRLLLWRERVYQLGSVTLAGAGIGTSHTPAVRDMARKFSKAGAAEKYCSFYVHQTDKNAKKSFNHSYLEDPRKLNADDAAKIYRKDLEHFFGNGPDSFLYCAENFNYIALGCNGMKHRGPSVFGMLLAFSGCEPESAAKIVNKIWGLNDVKPEVRLAIIEQGYKMGIQYPHRSNHLRSLFEKESQ